MTDTRDTKMSRRHAIGVIGVSTASGFMLMACKGEKKTDSFPSGKSTAPAKATPPAAASQEPPTAAEPTPPAAAGQPTPAKPQLATCEDANLNPQSKTLRMQLQYVAKSPYPEKKCVGCAQWVAGTYPAPCGGCRLFTGPIHGEGYCLSFAPTQNT